MGDPADPSCAGRQLYDRRASLALLTGGVLTACGGGGGSSGSAGGHVIIAPAPTPSPSASPSPTPSATPTGSVSVSAAARNMRFGSTFAWNAGNADSGSFQNPIYAALLDRDCAVLVPENELKWQEVRPSATTYNFDRFDAMLAWAEGRGKMMRGHTLLWYVQERFPAWLGTYDFGASPVAEAERLVREHAQTVCRRYGTRIYSYDVVNEAIDPATGALRINALANAVGGGTRLLDLAFQIARAEAPGAQLVYNDYMDWGVGSTHRDGVLALLRGFRDRGVPVDALGIQGHIGFYSTADAPSIVAARRDGWRRFLDDVVALGYDLVVTEFDVQDDDQIGRFDIPTRDERQRLLAKGFLEVALAYPQLRDVLVWGMSDRFSWIQNAARTRRPTLYDLDYAVKPLRTGLIELFDATATRPPPPARPR